MQISVPNRNTGNNSCKYMIIEKTASTIQYADKVVANLGICKIANISELGVSPYANQRANEKTGETVCKYSE